MKQSRFVLAGLLVALLAGAAAAQRRNSDRPMKGDGFREKATVAPVEISLDDSPIERLEVRPERGRRLEVAYRLPAGPGPHPTIVFIHGGLTSFGPQRIRASLRDNPTFTRFLARGWGVVAADFRTFRNELLAAGPVDDVEAIVRGTLELDRVDTDAVAVFGGSGGGHLALELVTRMDFPAAVLGEPASAIFLGILADYDSQKLRRIFRDPHPFFTPDLAAATERKVSGIETPLLFLESGKHMLTRSTEEILIPRLREAGVPLEVSHYPGNPHGFYWGNGSTEETLDRMVADVERFLGAHMRRPAGTG